MVIRARAGRRRYVHLPSPLQVKQDSLQYAEDMLAYLSGNLSSALKGLEENKLNVENEMQNLKLPAVAEEAPEQEAAEEE